jgi:hypothetical protein
MMRRRLSLLVVFSASSMSCHLLFPFEVPSDGSIGEGDGRPDATVTRIDGSPSADGVDGAQACTSQPVVVDNLEISQRR